jgi:adenosylhomocysteine nucleosidase
VLGIVVAMDREARIVRAALAACGLAHEARVAVSGIGAPHAYEAARALVDGGVTALAVIGLAGALVDGIAAGDLLLPDRVTDEQGGAIDGGAPQAAALQECLRDVAVVHAGLLASTARPLASPAAKRALAMACGAVAVDMESVAVARVARAAGLPWTVLRAVSDPVHRTLPCCALRAVDGRGNLRPGALVAALARRPWELGALLALGRDARRAQQVLGAAGAAALPVLCTPIRIRGSA